VRARLLRLGPQRHVLIWVVHHIAFDGGSVALFAREFVAIYSALRAGRAPRLPPLPVQYADYATWHRRRLDGGLLASQASFWRDYLRDAPSVSTLPADFARPKSASLSGDVVRVELSPTLAASLTQLARQHDATLFTVLSAAFLILLHRLSGTEDVVLGTDVAGRNRRELEDLIGFFVNVVPLRSRLALDTSFTEWLGKVRQNVLAAFEHQDTPFDQIVNLLSVPRDRTRNPLVQVLFVLQNLPEAHFDLPGLDIALEPLPPTQSKFDLAVFVSATAEATAAGGGLGAERGMVAEWHYATALYRRETIEQAARAWRSLLEQVVQTPQRLLRDFVFPPVRSIEKAHEKVRAEAISRVTSGKLDRLGRIAAGQSAKKRHRSGSRPAFPLEIQAPEAQVDAPAWARSQRDLIETQLCRHAAVLFRNFPLRTPEEFEAFAEAIEPELYGEYGDLPRKGAGRNIYQSTPYPERQMILFHNESAHLPRWPRKQLFFCELPSRVGGATPIVDCREVYRRLPAPLAEEFHRKELLYVRTFTERLDVSWQDFFRTTRREDVEAQLARGGTECRWLEGGVLQTRTRCPAVIAHPVTGEASFFNQIQLHHVSCLEAEVREHLLTAVGLERMPRHVYYGDGTPIEDETMALIGRIYEECAVRFDWGQGDVILLDNMLAAHARDPYEGPRRIVVAMGAMFDRSALRSRVDLSVSNDRRANQ
jgi:alpha-ketoglutarate-dependent taurine dioxygenase